MLTHLSVRNLAVVEDLALSFKSGMTSLTGETGAGKSMLVDALSLVLGDRADSSMVRHGTERAEIEASFDTANNPVLSQWLIDEELDDDGLCELRRTITRDGRSKGYINGRSVTLGQLRAVSERSIDIHGQHAHQSLVRAETQRELLDTVAKTTPLLNELKQVYKQWQQTKQQLNDLQQQSADQTARFDLLKYQVSELEALSLSDEKVSQLLKDQQQLANASELITAAESGLHHIFESDHGAAYDIISSTLSQLEKLQDIEPGFASMIETLNAAIINLDETGSELRHYLDNIELDPERLTQVETELSQLYDLARKHHVEIEALPEHYQQLSEELAALSNMEQDYDELVSELKRLETYCLDLCMQIREKRMQAATPLAEQITASINQLAIPSGRIEFAISPMTDGQFGENGADNIQILVSTNPGQPAGELAKVASGGELARISLSIQVVTAGQRSVPTLIFDEVDVGIGGGVAEIVGQHLRKLASTQQVICITHLAQVAAQAHHQLQVTKKHQTDSTHIEIHELSNAARVEEIARMLGGMQLTEKTRLHAEEMLEQAQHEVSIG